jgi:hypothetical protein
MTEKSKKMTKKIKKILSSKLYNNLINKLL